MFGGISKKEFMEATVGAVGTAVMVYILAVGFLLVF